jgi:hypothetical protein
MFAKTVIALTAALVVTTAFVSAADAQRRPQRQQSQTVPPFTDEERNWFEIPQGRDLSPRPY